MVSGTDARVRLVDRWGFSNFAKLVEHLGLAAHRVDRLLEDIPLRSENQPRRQQLEDRAQLAEIGGEQRIRRRHRRVRNADVHRAEMQQRVLDVVAREHDERPLRGQLLLQQVLPDAPRALERLRDTSASSSHRPARCAKSTRSGATRAQCSSRSVIFAGYGGQRVRRARAGSRRRGRRSTSDVARPEAAELIRRMPRISNEPLPGGARLSRICRDELVCTDAASG